MGRRFYCLLDRVQELGRKERRMETGMTPPLPESRLQAEVVTVLQLHRFFPLMIPNGEVRDLTPQKYQRLVAQGFRKGAPDLLIFDLLNTQTAPLHLELKTDRGKLSTAQKNWATFCEKHGMIYRVARSAEEAVQLAKEWRKNNGGEKKAGKTIKI